MLIILYLGGVFMPTRKPFRPIKPFVPGEKLSEVLKKIDYETLKNNKSWYASCERARQHWDGTGAGSQNAMRFYTGGHFGADAYEKAQKEGRKFGLKDKLKAYLEDFANAAVSQSKANMIVNPEIINHLYGNRRGRP